ncbi:MAG: PKD domain-containing protein, partial [Chitinophagales bacterium]
MIVLLVNPLTSIAQTIVIEDFTPKEICEGETIDITISGIQLNANQTVNVLFPYSYVDEFDEVYTDAKFIDAEIINETTIRTEPIQVYKPVAIPNDFLLDIQVKIDDETSENASTQLKVSPNTPPIIAGDACESLQVQNYQAFDTLDNSIGQMYQWQVSNNGNIVGKSDSSVVQVAWSNTEDGTLSLQTTNDLGCVSNLEKNIVITNNANSFPLFLSSNLEANIADEQKEVLFTAFAEGADSYEFWVDDEIKQDASKDSTFTYTFTSLAPSLTSIGHHLIRVVAEKDGVCEEATLYIEVVQHPLGHDVSFFGEGVKGANNFLNANELFDPIFKALPEIDRDVYEISYTGTGVVLDGNDEEYYFNPGMVGDETVTIFINARHIETEHSFEAIAPFLDITGPTDFFGITDNNTICNNAPPILISPDFEYLSDEIGYDTLSYQFEGVKVQPLSASETLEYLEGDDNPLTQVIGTDSLVYSFDPSILPVGKYFIDVVMRSLDFDYAFSAGYITIEIQEAPILPTIPETIFYCADQIEDFRIGAFGNTIRWYESIDSTDPIRIDDSLFIVSISDLKDTTIVFVTQQPGVCESDRLKVDLIKNPVPTLAFDVDGLCEGETPVFTNNTVIPEGVEVVEWEWDFGDGSQSNLKNPGLHSYANNTPGTIYSVSLQVKTTQGCELQQDTTVAFQANAKPVFDWYNTCQNNLIQFEIPTTQQIEGAQWMWDFGDGTKGEGVAPVHQYSDASVYDVKLTVASDAFCSDNVSLQIFVLEQIELENEYINDFEEEANGWIAVPSTSGNDWE